VVAAEAYSSTTTTTTALTAHFATSKSFSFLKTTVQMAGKAINYHPSAEDLATIDPQASFI
jgi:hypothetical protein